MAKFRAFYTTSFCVDIEADSYDDAMDILDSYSNNDIADGQLLEDMELYLDEVIEMN
jgi:hypothetical protein